jgi:hypothetical protein
MNCEQDLPQFTQEQKEEFSKLALDFLVRNNFKEHIPLIAVEIKLKSNILEEADVNKVELRAVNLSANLMDCGCRDTDDPRVGDPCYPQVWASR